MQERPRFRNDLVAQPVTEGGERFVDVTDPDSGSTFRFYEVEYAVACAMDGQRDVAGLAAWSQAELGLTPSASEISTVVGTLGDLGYLDKAATAAAAADVELGSPGKSPIATEEPPARADSGMDLELGAAGASDDDAFDTEADTQIAPVTRIAPDNDDVSVDLSQHLSIDTDDVKEAVRQSRVMSAVEAPVDEPEPKPEPKKEEPKAKAKPAARKPVSKSSLSASVAEEAAKDEQGSKPVVEIPSKAPEVAAAASEAAAKAEPKSGGGSTTILLVILLLAILGGGGFFVYTNYFAGDKSSSVDPADNKAAVASVNVAAKKKL